MFDFRWHYPFKIWCQILQLLSHQIKSVSAPFQISEWISYKHWLRRLRGKTDRLRSASSLSSTYDPDLFPLFRLFSSARCILLFLQPSFGIFHSFTAVLPLPLTLLYNLYFFPLSLHHKHSFPHKSFDQRAGCRGLFMERGLIIQVCVWWL